MCSVLDSWDQIARSWGDKRVLVIGDVMLDIERHCLEGNTYNEFGKYTLKEISQNYHPGAAANLAVNLKRLGCASVELIGAVAEDTEGSKLCELLDSEGVHFPWRHNYIRRLFHATTTKERIYVRNEPLHRIDRDSCNRLLIDEILRWLDQPCQRNKYDALLISDYQKGAFFCRYEIESICWSFKERNPNAIVTGNLKPQLIKNLFFGCKERFFRFDLIQLNEYEMEDIVGRHSSNPAWSALHLTKARNLLYTVGGKGMTLVAENGEYITVPGYKVQKSSSVGAGDTVFAAITLAMHSTKNMDFQVAIANAAGAARVQNKDRQWITPKEIQKTLSGDFS